MCAQVTIPNRPLGTDQRSIEAILANFDAVTAQVNGNLDSTNIAASLAASAGVNIASQAVKGSSVILTEEQITNTAYAAAPTRDHIPSLVVPANSLLLVSFRACVLKTGGTNPEGLWARLDFSAGINPTVNLFAANFGIPPSVENPGYISNSFETHVLQYAPTVSGVVATHPILGLASAGVDGAGHDPQDITSNGQQVGVFVPIAENTGTFDVHIDWKIDAGATCFISSRRLYARVWTFS